MASFQLIFRRDHTIERVKGESSAKKQCGGGKGAERQLCKEPAGEVTKVGTAAKRRGCSKLAASSAGEDNQGGAELCGALKEATRRMNLMLQLRHTQHCPAIVFIIQLQLSNFVF